MPILCKASELHTRRTSPFPACCRPAQPLRDRRLLRRGPMRHPCLSVDTGTVLPSDGPGSPLSAVSFLSALRTSPSGSCRRRAGIGPYLPFAPRKGRRRRHRPLPAKNRNFLDLWQTIAQDLSRLFAVPGCCPPCSGSPKGWPGLCHRHALATGQGQSLRCFRRPRARACCRNLPESASRCLAGRRCPRRHGHDDTAGTHALPACSPHSTGGPERDGCPRRCDTVPWTWIKSFGKGDGGARGGRGRPFPKVFPLGPAVVHPKKHIPPPPPPPPSHPLAAFTYSTRSYHGPADLAYP